jgi:hypothetical protein
MPPAIEHPTTPCCKHLRKGLNCQREPDETDFKVEQQATGPIYSTVKKYVGPGQGVARV